MNTWFFRRSFWGTLLIILGSIWLLDNVFDLDIPVFRILISLALILLGIAVIQGRPASKISGNQTAFGEAIHTFRQDDKAHSVLFGEASIDLSHIKGDGVPIELRCTFGEMRVKLGVGQKVKINGEVTFGSIQMPDGQSQSFGRKEYASSMAEGQEPALEVNVQCIFGSVRFLLIDTGARG